MVMVMQEEAFIRIQNVSRSFAGYSAVDAVNLRLPKGIIHALTGESGSGKTTLLRLIAGFEIPDSGSITVGERILTDQARGIMLLPEKRQVGMVFQENNLFPHLTVAQNIAYGVEKRHRRARVEKLLNLVHLEPYAGRYPHQISGGQAQRVALARALAPEPDLLLMDEPFSSLDHRLKTHLLPEIKRTIQTVGITTIFVSHDRNEVFDLADEISVMRDGAIVQSGKPRQLYERPVSCYVADFLGEANFLHGQDDTLMIRPEHIYIGQLSSEGGQSISSAARIIECYYRGNYHEYWAEAEFPDLNIQTPLILQIRHNQNMGSENLKVGDNCLISFYRENLLSLKK